MTFFINQRIKYDYTSYINKISKSLGQPTKLEGEYLKNIKNYLDNSCKTQDYAKLFGILVPFKAFEGFILGYLSAMYCTKLNPLILAMAGLVISLATIQLFDMVRTEYEARVAHNKGNKLLTEQEYLTSWSMYSVRQSVKYSPIIFCILAPTIILKSLYITIATNITAITHNISDFNCKNMFCDVTSCNKYEGKTAK